MSIQTVGLYCILLSYMLLFRPRYYTFLYISWPNLLHHDTMQPVISFTAPMLLRNLFTFYGLTRTAGPW